MPTELTICHKSRMRTALSMRDHSRKKLNESLKMDPYDLLTPASMLNIGYTVLMTDRVEPRLLS